MPETTEIHLYPKQSAFVLTEAKYSAFIGGRGTGKSFSGCVKDIAYLWEHPESWGYICAPTYPMLRDNTMATFLELLPPSWIADYKKQQMLVTLTNGSRAYFRSLEKPDRARGPNLHFVHVDEGAYVAEAAWVILKATLRRPGHPQKGWVTSTPRGKNWVYWEFAHQQRDKYALFQARSEENPYLPEDYIEFAEGKSEEYIRQEVGGEFVGFEGLVYKTFSRSLHVTAERPEGTPRRTFAGVDWGFRDPAVVVVVQDFGERGLYIPELYYQAGATIDQHAAAAQALRDRYRINAFYADPSRPDSIAFFQNKGLNTNPAVNDIVLGIQAVTQRINMLRAGVPELRVHPSCGPLIDELEIYQYPAIEGKGTPRNPTEVPLDKDNHAADALRYATVALFPVGSGITEFYRRRVDKLTTRGGIVLPNTRAALEAAADAGVSLV